MTLLARSGHRVVTATGRPEMHEYLGSLGAESFIDRAALLEKGPPLQKERWGGCIDSVGGQTLVTALTQTVSGGAVAACGSGPVGGPARLGLPVHPAWRNPHRHYVRDPAAIPPRAGLGASCPRPRVGKPRTMYEVQPFETLPDLAEKILANRIRGGVVLSLKG